MCRLQCLLALILLTITTVSSWDIAITAEKEIEFYDKGIKAGKVDVPKGKLTALAYDAVYNLLLFVDKHSDNASIFSYNFTSQNTRSLVRKKFYEQIEGIAFDPLTGRLFWTDIDAKGIYYKSLKGNEKGSLKGTDDFGTLLFNVSEQNPRDIAVDSCRGYIYWTNIAYKRASIMKARLDGTQGIPDVVVNTEIYKPVSIAIDQRERKMYWADDEEGIHYAIWSADLDGKNKILMSKGIQHQPNSLTVSKDSIFWIDWDQSTVWKLPKIAEKVSAPEAVIIFSGSPFGIVANYPIDEQTQDIPECNKLRELSQNRPVINGSIDVPLDAGIYCLHGYQIDSMTCKCTQGYTGDRCEIPICHNYCLRGQCKLTADGEAKCKCESGYTGERCDVELCLHYCLNDGQCSVSPKGEPSCACSDRYEGRRCETRKVDKGEPTPVIADTDNTQSVFEPRARQGEPGVIPETTAISTASPTVGAPNTESCNCTSETKAIPTTKSADVGDFLPTSDCDGWDPIRDPILMLLGIICGFLCIACTFLMTKIMQLKKRPRIKKRIIVNKNVTPLTARPDQCEITIENCCNMNICETPCFEPRSTIRPTLLDAKPGKEEKRNLIANMELPDD